MALNRRRWILSGLALSVLVVILAGWYLQQLWQRPLQLAPQLLEVKSGSHARSLLQQLKALGADIDPQLAYYQLRIRGRGDRLQAGVYDIAEDLSLADLVNRIELGQQHLFRITLVEGLTLAQWRAQLKSVPHLDAKTSALSATQLHQLLDPEQRYPSLEGALLPETYSYKAGTSDLQILQDAFAKMQQELEQAWAERDRGIPIESPYHLLIMASIIEKETGVASERGLVSSVFMNRLRSGMRLQSDPTTIYGIENFDGDLTRAHLREQTAYNTYRIDGLPPTPIAMPSVASLRAAAQPADSEYYYFVANDKGEHIFSKTLAEHNRAVNRYQRGQKQ